MNKRLINSGLIIGLTLSAWCLYVASLFLPAANVDWNSANGIPKGGDLEQGLEVLLVCVIPICWIAVFPCVYLIVNVVFFFLLAGSGFIYMDGRATFIQS